MTFSIVIPTYNGAEFVAEAINSALRQTRPADEVIVSDDNSTDETIQICKRYGNRIKLYVHKDGPSGFVNGWNRAVAHAVGDYISILHQDDLLAPTFLEEMEHGLRQYPQVKHLFVPCNYIDASGKITSTPNYCDGQLKLYSGSLYVKAYYTIGVPNIHRCPGVMTHHDIFKQCRYREEAGHIADDDFFYRVGQYTDVLAIMLPLAFYREHLSSETSSIGDNLLSKRLLKDYSFQLKHFSENRLFDKADKAFFRYWKRQHLRRVIGNAIKRGNLQDIVYALRYL